MSRIEDKFNQLKSNNEAALISYIMAGYPSEKATLSAVRGLIRGGTDIIELGFPFSDPIADGPTIQMASTESLNNGTKIDDFFTRLKNFSIFAPLFNETVLAFCITGPSAIGSENGNPNSIMSVPPLTRPLTIDSVVFSSGNPVMMYEINAFSFLDFNSLNLS